jgi:hypothetical protein
MKELMAFISMRFTTEEFLTRLLEDADVDDGGCFALGFRYRSYKHVGNV